MKEIKHQKPLVPKQNIVDRVVSYFDPVRGRDRLKARTVMALAGGGYNGGKRDRKFLRNWVTGASDANADTIPDLPTLRERSRDLVRNTPIAGGAIETKVTSVVGTGLKLQSRIDRTYLAETIGMTDAEADAWESHIEREFSLWADTQACDMERTLTFCGIQSLCFRSRLESGDVIVMMPFVERPGDPFGLRLQVIEADRLSNPENAKDTDRMIAGVSVDENNAPETYHIYKGHPGSQFRSKDKAQWMSVPAFGEATGRRNVLHLFHKVRPGQTRGVPDLAPVMELIKTLGDYTDSEAKAALVSSFFTVFIESEGGAGISDIDPATGLPKAGESSDGTLTLGPGLVADLAPGEKANFADPSRPNTAFDPFVLALSRQLGARLQLPFEVLIKHFTASYSASRAALIEVWRYYMTERKFLESYLCNPVYAAVVEESVARGRTEAPGFLDDPMVRRAFLGAEWVGPAQGNLNPLQEAKADALEEDRGWQTAAGNTAKRGGDWMMNHQQRKKEVAMRREDDLEPEIADDGNPADDVPID